MTNQRYEGGWTVMVAIPVKDEVDRIGACLHALAAQRGANEAALPPFGVLLYVNNSTDGTADLARSLASGLTYPLHVVEATLPPEEASAGGARRRAMEDAARRLEESGGTGLLMTTDADSRVPPHWIAATLAALEAGVDAVAGTVALDPREEAALPSALKARGALEARYEALVCELETRLHPNPHDPWPRHPCESGASFALTLASYRAVGGVPVLALGEDRALAAALRGAGFRIRHAPDLVVITSGRLIGRASGGCADTMRLRIEKPSVHCDEYLRPVIDVLRATSLRSSGKRSRLLAPGDLPLQIRFAETLLIGLRALDATTSATQRLYRSRGAHFPPSTRRDADLRTPQPDGFR